MGCSTSITTNKLSTDLLTIKNKNGFTKLAEQIDYEAKLFSLTLVFDQLVETAREVVFNDKWRSLKGYSLSFKAADLLEKQKEEAAVDIGNQIGNEWMEDTFFMRDSERNKGFYKELNVLFEALERKGYTESYVFIALFVVKHFVIQVGEMQQDRFKVKEESYEKVVLIAINLIEFYNDKCTLNFNEQTAKKLYEELNLKIELIVEVISKK